MTNHVQIQHKAVFHFAIIPLRTIWIFLFYLLPEVNGKTGFLTLVIQPVSVNENSKLKIWRVLSRRIFGILLSSHVKSMNGSIQAFITRNLRKLTFLTELLAIQTKQGLDVSVNVSNILCQDNFEYRFGINILSGKAATF